MKKNAVLAMFLGMLPALSVAGEGVIHTLVQSYSLNDRVCKKVAAMLSDDEACRPLDALSCSEGDDYSINIHGAKRNAFESISTNQYGYTQVFRAPPALLNGFSVVYVQLFEGDGVPRLVETWKVNSEELESVLKIPPGPWSYEEWININPKPPQETNAAEFSGVLNRGEKLSEEWSPVIEVDGNPYLVERECSGKWEVGAFYACNRVIKLTVKKLSKDKRAVPYCQYARRKK